MIDPVSNWNELYHYAANMERDVERLRAELAEQSRSHIAAHTVQEQRHGRELERLAAEVERLRTELDARDLLDQHTDDEAAAAGGEADSDGY